MGAGRAEGLEGAGVGGGADGEEGGEGAVEDGGCEVRGGGVEGWWGLDVPVEIGEVGRGEDGGEGDCVRGEGGDLGLREGEAG